MSPNVFLGVCLEPRSELYSPSPLFLGLLLRAQTLIPVKPPWLSNLKKVSGFFKMPQFTILLSSQPQWYLGLLQYESSSQLSKSYLQKMRQVIRVKFLLLKLETLTPLIASTGMSPIDQPGISARSPHRVNSIQALLISSIVTLRLYRSFPAFVLIGFTSSMLMAIPITSIEVTLKRSKQSYQ
jgi:hypothetical protein